MTTHLPPAHIEAPAKLTLSLQVTGVRDDGYHLIDAEMVSLDLCDIVTVNPSSTSSVYMSGPLSTGIPVDENNLVMKALSLAKTTASISIEKHIPAGGGLGGGSTNAAAILRWSHFEDHARASTIGADVPFCMVGGRAHVTGIGEIISPCDYQPLDITLVIPDLHVATPDVYRMWDTMGGPRHESGNDLEPAALAVCPDLAAWKVRITDTCGHTPTLAGSGSTWFLVGHHRQLDGLAHATVIYTSTRPDAGAITPT